MAIAGIVTGALTIYNGETIAGAGLIGASVLGYLTVEGYVDAQYAKNTVDFSIDILDEIAEMTATQLDDMLLQILERISEQLATVSDVEVEE